MGGPVEGHPIGIPFGDGGIDPPSPAPSLPILLRVERTLSASRLPISSLFAWAAAVLIGVTPALLAADHGGNLPRTQWIASLVALLAVLLAIPVTFARQRATGLRPHLVAILLIFASAAALLQMVPLSGRVVNSLSSGSANAYQQWLFPLSLTAIDSQSVPTRFPISVAPWLTGGYAAMLIVTAAFAWVASTVFTSRQRISLLMMLILATGTLHAVFGFYQLLHDPSANVWGVEGLEGGNPFGVFINRNNSAVLINLGLGCSIGLLAWRLAALTGYQLAGGPIPGHALLDLLTDRTAVLALVGGIVCGAGLIASGSRGGLAGGIAGGLLAFGLVTSIRRGRGLMSLIVGVALMTAVLMVRYELPHETLDRLGATGDGISKSVASDGRFDHWPDGARAAQAYFPAGAGAGTYRYAYLPFQQSSSPSWFVNADNLWLEWLVEMGLFGAILLAFFLLIICRALIAVNYSPDALDHGLATAGWFALGATAVTQFFDFGLTLLPAAIVTAILFSAVITRSRSLRAESPMLPRWMTSLFPLKSPVGERPRGWQRLLHGRGVAALALAGLAVTMWFAQSAFAVRARSQALQREQRDLLASETASLENWQQLIDAYRAHLADAPNDAIGRLHAGEAEMLFGRLSAAASLTESPETLPQIVQQLSPRALRSAWYRGINAEIDSRSTDEQEGALESRQLDDPQRPRLDLSLTNVASQDGNAPDGGEQEEDVSESSTDDDASRESSVEEADIVRALDETGNSLPVPLLPIDSELPITLAGIGTVPGSLGPMFHRVRTEAIQSLRHSPLADESRYLLAELDFAGGSPKQSRELLAQLASLRRQNGTSLQQIGEAAAAGNMWDLAASVWKRAMQVSPNQTSAILAEVHAAPAIRPSNVVPSTTEALTAAATFELRKSDYDPILFDQALKVLRGNLPVDRQARSERLKLVAQIERKMGDEQAAAQSYKQAVALYPGNADLRFSYANSLAAAGNIDLARQEARTGRQLAPDDPRFDRLIEQLAEQSKRRD